MVRETVSLVVAVGAVLLLVVVVVVEVVGGAVVGCSGDVWDGVDTTETEVLAVLREVGAWVVSVVVAVETGTECGGRVGLRVVVGGVGVYGDEVVSGAVGVVSS